MNSENLQEAWEDDVLPTITERAFSTNYIVLGHPSNALWRSLDICSHLNL